MSLIQNINAPNIPQLIKSMISMGHDLGLYVSAEGVETEEQSAFLKSAGCDFAQGYYYYKPLGNHQVEDVLIQRKRPSNPKG
jgi:EAL domain-containing protein (putative c-di-GMP-specific phosphodiesterase class I)